MQTVCTEARPNRIDCFIIFSHIFIGPYTSTQETWEKGVIMRLWYLWHIRKFSPYDKSSRASTSLAVKILSLQLLLYFMYVSSKCSSKTCGCAGSSEPYLLANVINTKLLCTGLYDIFLSFQRHVVLYRTVLLFGFGLMATFGSSKLDFPGAGPLGCLTMAFVAAFKWRKEDWSKEGGVSI